MSNAADDVFAQAETDPGHALFARRSEEGEWRTVTAGEFAREVTAVARGLVAAGIRPGDRIAIMSPTRYEWVLADYAIWTVGAVTVPIYETNSAEQAAWILADSGALAAFAGNSRLAGLVEPVGGPVWTFDDGGLDCLEAQGKTAQKETLRNGDVRRLRTTDPDTIATIVYTSGTTGRPKGCVLTHGNLVDVVDSVVRFDGLSDQVLTPEASLLLFLPLAHILARVVQLAVVRTGTLTGHFGDVAAVASELTTFRPTLILAVPRVFEKLVNAADREAAASGHTRIFGMARRVAVNHSAQGRSRLAHRVFDRLIYRKLRDALGGRVRYTVSGGAPLAPELAHFLRGAGIPVLEGYGLTETTAATTLNPPGAERVGTVGRPLPGWDVRIAPDGEVLLRGPGVFHGYWHDDEATAAAVEDGWLRSGDIGELSDGYLTITARKKEVIVTAGGKNVAPAFLEDRLHTHWLIDNCVVVGDRRPFVGALVTLDPEGFADWKRAHDKPSGASVAELRHDPDLSVTLRSVIDEVNQAVSRAEAIKDFRVLPASFTVNNELTPTQKVRREYVMTKYADDIEELYWRGERRSP